MKKLYQSLILGNVALIVNLIGMLASLMYQSLILGNVEQQIVFKYIITPSSYSVK